MPESLMLQDTKRSNGYLAKVLLDTTSEGTPDDINIDEQVRIIKDGVLENRGKEFTPSMWRNWLFGSSDTLEGTKRRLARLTSLEAICYFKVVDDPTNLVLHYNFMGASHRRSFGGEGCIFTQTTPEEKIPISGFETSPTNVITGNFAKMQWMTSIPTELTTWGFAHDGKHPTFLHAYVQITEGPGSGSTLYRIIHPWGTMREGDAGASTKAPYLGFGWILDRPWANGTPDQTSKVRLITCTKDNVGEPLYIISPDLYSPMSPDANLSPSTPYGDICEDLVVRIYGWMHYIKSKTGHNPDLDANSTFIHDYVQKIVFTNPYNWATYSNGYTRNGARQWEVAVMNQWYGRPQTKEETARSIDWKGIPGILTWCGVPVAGKEVPILGDLNNDGVVDATDMGMLLSRWGTNYSEYDLNNDGVIDAVDLSILQLNWGKKKQT